MLMEMLNEVRIEWLSSKKVKRVLKKIDVGREKYRADRTDEKWYQGLRRYIRLGYYAVINFILP